MVWNIIKKDWKLMGRSALGLIALQLIYAFNQLRGTIDPGRFTPMQFHYVTLFALRPVLIYLWLIAGVIWIITLVHQDPLPGTRQDWLIRPIQRTNLLTAKLVLAATVMQGSTFACDLILGLGNGLPLGQTLRAALVRALMGFVMITIPAFLLGTLTQSIPETVVIAAILAMGILALTRIGIRLAGGDEHYFDPTMGSGIYWLPNLLRLVILLIGGAAILVMQYRTRSTARGRIAVAMLAVLILCTQTISWKAVWAVQKSLSPHHGAADAIAMEWNIHPAPQEPGSNALPWSGGVTDERQYYLEKMWLHLPVTVTGIPADSVLIEDNAQLVLSDADGNKLQTMDGGSFRTVLREGAQLGPYAYKQVAPIPRDFYQQDPNRMVRVQTTYSMTLFKLGSSYSVPAVNGDRTIPGIGRCQTSINPGNTSADAICVQMGKALICETAFMEDPRDGSRNRRSDNCVPNYGPYLQRPIPDAATYTGFFSQFRIPDMFGIYDPGRYPVGETKVHNAQFVIRTYEVAEHFTRVVNSPLIPLKDVTAYKW